MTLNTTRELTLSIQNQLDELNKKLNENNQSASLKRTSNVNQYKNSKYYCSVHRNNTTHSTADCRTLKFHRQQCSSQSLEERVSSIIVNTIQRLKADRNQLLFNQPCFHQQQLYYQNGHNQQMFQQTHNNQQCFVQQQGNNSFCNWPTQQSTQNLNNDYNSLNHNENNEGQVVYNNNVYQHNNDLEMVSRAHVVPEIFIKTNLSNNILKACIDTASPITLVRLGSIECLTKIFPQFKIGINGITKDNLYTEGTAKLEIFIGNEVLSIIAQTIKNENSNLSYDILLGTDFQKKYNLLIDWQDEITTIRTERNKYSFYFNRKPGKLSIPPFSESVQVVKINNKYNVEMGFIEKIEIAPGAFISNSIVQPLNDKAYVNVFNITATPIELENIELQVLPLTLEEKLVIQKDVDIFNDLNCNHLNARSSSKLKNLILNYKNIFISQDNEMNTTHLLKHHINLKPGSSPVYKKQPIIPNKHDEQFRTMLKNLKDQGIIEKSSSPWNHRIFLIPKKTGELRAVLDFRPLNDLTIDVKYDIPSIEDLLSKIGNSQLFSNLDLSSAYHQIELTEESKDLCTFSAGKYGRWRYKKMPFGISGAPYTFQFLMDSIFTLLDEPPIHVLAYLDDLLIYSENEDQHFEHLERVFKKLQEANLRLNIKKCNFLKSEVQYLGFIIKEGRVSPPKEYINSLKDIRLPKSRKELEKVLGKFGYVQKFIKNFQIKARPLSKLLHKDKKFELNQEEIETFERLKDELINITPLSLPKHQKYELHIDASSVGVGAMLLNAEDKESPPIMYLSAVLSPTQMRYSATELEMFALTYFVNKLKHYLIGREFTVCTDHKALEHIMKSKNIDNLRLNKMKLALSDFNMKIKYIKGKSNKVPDYLSRYPSNNEETLDIDDILFEKENGNITIFPITRAQAKQQQIQQQNIHINDLNQLDINKLYDSQEGSQIILGNKNKKFSFNKSNLPYKAESDMYQEDFNKLLKSSDVLENFNKNIFPKTTNYTAFTENCITIYRLPKNSKIIRITNENFDKVERTKLGLKCSLSKQCMNLPFILYLFITVTQKFMIETNQNTITLISSLSDDDIEFIKRIWCILCDLKNEKFKLLLFNKDITVLKNDKEIREILDAYHLSETAGHPGMSKMIAELKKNYYFNNMTSKVRKYVNQCLTCRKVKASRQHISPMVIPKLPKSPFELIATDVYGPILSSDPDEYNNILVITDYFSGFTIMKAIKDPTSEQVAQAIVYDLILTFGRIPKVILSDNASYFGSKLMSQVLKLLKIKQKFITPRAPWQNITERRNPYISYYLKYSILESKNIKKWPDMLPFISYSINSSINRTTGYSPFELLFGLDVEKIEDLKLNYRNKNQITYSDYVEELRQKLLFLHENASENMKSAREASKTYYDKNTNQITLKVGDLVLWKNPKNILGKLDIPRLGPFKVEQLFKTSALITVGKKSKLVPLNNLHRYEPPLNAILFIKMSQLPYYVKEKLIA